MGTKAVSAVVVNAKSSSVYPRVQFLANSSTKAACYSKLARRHYDSSKAPPQDLFPPKVTVLKAGFASLNPSWSARNSDINSNIRLLPFSILVHEIMISAVLLSCCIDWLLIHHHFLKDHTDKWAKQRPRLDGLRYCR